MEAPDPRLAEFLDALPDAALVIEGGARVAHANAAARALLGYPAGALEGRPLADLVAIGGAPPPWPAGAFRLALRHRHGQRLLLAASHGPMPAPGPARTILLLRREANEPLEQAVRVSNIGIFDHDMVADTIYWSPEQRANYGWSPEEPVTLAKFLSQVFPADVERIGTAVRAAHDPAGDGLFDVEHRIVRRDGQVRWLLTRSQTFFAGEGAERRPVRTVGAVVDITERREAEQRLRRSEARLNEAQRIARIGSWELDLTQDALTWSAEIFRIFELDPARFGASYEAFMALVHPDDRALVDAAYRRAVTEHTRYDIVHRLLLPDGRIKHVREQAETEYDEAGRPVRSAGTVQDVTAQVLAEEALRLKDQAIATAISGFAITDGEGRILYANPAFVRMWGYEREAEVLDRSPAEFADPVAVAELIAVVRRDGSWQGELQGRRRDGSTFDLLLSASAVMDRAGQVTHLMGSFLDVTERKRLDAQLQQVQKMESVGRLAGGVAHDFNNLLTAINGFVELALLDVRPGDPVHELLQEVLRAGASAAELTQQLLAFSRRQVIDPRVLNLNEVVTHVHRMLQRLLGEDIALETMLAGDLGQVRVDRSQVEQILVNLGINARDAMPAGGKLTIETANVTLDAEYCAHHPHVQPGAYVLLAVSDEGVGMADEVKAHLFEPFFTTKAIGRGTGLGLAMVYGAVKQNRGSIEVYSELQHGTTFKMYFPRVDERPEARATPAPGPLPSGTETIALVEDDAKVRRVASRMLERLGYRVLAYGSGPEAIAAVRALTEPLHLLVTDVVLPGMNGRVLAGEIGALRPGIRVLFASGYTANVVVHHGVLERGVEFIPKPYSIDLLARRVREVLDRR